MELNLVTQLSPRVTTERSPRLSLPRWHGAQGSRQHYITWSSQAPSVLRRRTSSYYFLQANHPKCFAASRTSESLSAAARLLSVLSTAWLQPSRSCKPSPVCCTLLF